MGRRGLLELFGNLEFVSPDFKIRAHFCSILSLALLFSNLWLSAQVDVLSIVVNSSNQPVPYATIKVLRKNLGTYSRADGTFALKNLSIQDTLVISHLGYSSIEVPVSKLHPRIVLIETTEKLDEITIHDERVKSKRLELSQSKGRKKLHLNLSSFEIGSLFEFHFTETRRLEELVIPISPGKSPAFVKVNVYSVFEERPDTLIFTQAFFIDDTKKLSCKIESHIFLNGRSQLFVSIEMMGYGRNQEFESLDKSKDALAVYLVHWNLSKASFTTRNFSHNAGWHVIKSEEYNLNHSNSVPCIQVKFVVL